VKLVRWMALVGGYLPRLTTTKYVAADTCDFAIQHYHLTASSLDIDTVNQICGGKSVMLFSSIDFEQSQGALTLLLSPVLHDIRESYVSGFSQ
jgi:hypothetical protein